MRCEYERIGVRQCGAGRRRTSCGDNSSARSDRYRVTCRSATWMLKGFSCYITSDEYEDLPLRPLWTTALFENTECVSCGTASLTCRTCRSEEHTSELQSPVHLVC